MKVLLDSWIFNEFKTGGVYRYFLNLIRESKNNPELDYQLACLFGETVSELGELNLWAKPGRNISNQTVRSFTNKMVQATNILYSLTQFSSASYDILHPTYYSLYYPFILGRIKKPIAVTVYDMIHELYPQYMVKNNSTPQKKKLLCEKADIIFAISEHTKTDIVNILNINPDKIKVTYLAGGFEQTKLDEDLISILPAKYILFVGGRQGYKNFERFLNAIITFLKADNDLFLVCTGGGFSSNEKAWFTHLGIDQKVVHFFANDENFYTIYNRASVFVFPSLYEGFGLPILEAFSAGCPVASSYTGSLKEIAGDAALYFDPLSEEEIRNSVKKLVYGTELRKELIIKGSTRYMDFSWAKTANVTYEGYKKII